MVGQGDGSIGTFVICGFEDFFGNSFFAIACVDDKVGSVFFREGQAFVSGVDTDYFQA